MNKIALLSICLAVYCTASFGQEIERSTLGVNGSSSELKTAKGTYLVQQSIGQSGVIGTSEKEGLILRQGFIQSPIIISSVIEKDSNLEAILYPNPFTSSINVEFSESLEETLMISIYDMMGRNVYTNQMKAAQKIGIDLEFLSSAAYVIRISSGEKQFNANIIKR